MEGHEAMREFAVTDTSQLLSCGRSVPCSLPLATYSWHPVFLCLVLLCLFLSAQGKCEEATMVGGLPLSCQVGVLR